MSSCFPISILPACCFLNIQSGLNQIKKTFPSLFPQAISETPKKTLQSYHVADLSNKNIREFFNELFEKPIDQPLNELTDQILKALPLSKLEEIILKEDLDHIDSLLKRLAENLPKEPKSKLHAENNSHAHGTHMITSFLPNLFHVFYRAFELFNLDCPPETLYEYGVLVTLYINFFAIFYYAISALNILIGNPVYVLAIASAGLASAIGALYGYLRCMKQCPSRVSYCIKPGDYDTVNLIGCKEKYQEVASHFNKICNIALVGEPGTGKTEFMKSLPAKLPNFKGFIFDKKALAGGGTSMLKIVDRVKTALRDVAGFENQVVLCMDEVGNALKKDETMETLLLDGIKTRFVATMTQEQWDGLSNELKQRFKPIYFKPDDDALTLEILKGRAKEASIQITDDALQKIIENTNKDQAKYAQPRKAIEAFTALQGRLSQFHIDSYKTPELKEKQRELKKIKRNCFEINNPKVQFEDQDKLAKETKPLVETVERQKTFAKKIKGYLAALAAYREQHIALVRLFKQKGSLNEAEKKQFVFAEFFAIHKLKQLIRGLENHLNPDVYVHLNEAMVRNFFDLKEAKR